MPTGATAARAYWRQMRAEGRCVSCRMPSLRFARCLWCRRKHTARVLRWRQKKEAA